MILSKVELPPWGGAVIVGGINSLLKTTEDETYAKKRIKDELIAQWHAANPKASTEQFLTYKYGENATTCTKQRTMNNWQNNMILEHYRDILKKQDGLIHLHLLVMILISESYITE